MDGRLSKITFDVCIMRFYYNISEARKACLHQAFRASFTLAASLYIAARDAEAFGDLALRQRRRHAETVPEAYDLPLARGKRSGERAVHGKISVVIFHCGKAIILAANNVLQGERIAVAIGFERVGQG